MQETGTNVVLATGHERPLRTTRVLQRTTRPRADLDEQLLPNPARGVRVMCHTGNEGAARLPNPTDRASASKQEVL